MRTYIYHRDSCPKEQDGDGRGAAFTKLVNGLDKSILVNATFHTRLSMTHARLAHAQFQLTKLTNQSRVCVYVHDVPVWVGQL